MAFAPGDGEDGPPRRGPGRAPRLSALETFEAAARLGSFSAAAAGMNLTSGAVSRQIALLENDLGTALFTRVARGVGLTPAGQRLHAAAVGALACQRRIVGLPLPVAARIAIVPAPSAVIVLNASIRASLDAHNADAKPFRWTAPADTIIGKHHRRKRLLESLP
ncbi:MAG: LysR family transcriptional regulator [Roseomonas sp.]|nr:LysR family transcriptional regulator [Roseomonas sp.]